MDKFVIPLWLTFPMLDIDREVSADMTDCLFFLLLSLLLKFLNGSVLCTFFQTDLLKTNMKNIMIPLLQLRILRILNKVSIAD